MPPEEHKRQAAEADSVPRFCAGTRTKENGKQILQKMLW